MAHVGYAAGVKGTRTLDVAKKVFGTICLAPAHYFSMRFSGVCARTLVLIRSPASI
jgi:hypothetical protein